MMKTPAITVDVSDMVKIEPFYMIGQHAIGRNLSSLHRAAVVALGLEEKCGELDTFDHIEHATLVMLTMQAMSSEPLNDLFVFSSKDYFPS
jgi:hypothetical protein